MKSVELGEIFDITSSKRVFQSEWKDKGIPFFRAREIVKISKYGFVDNELFISEEMYEDYKSKYGVPKEDDILITGVGTLGITYKVKKGDKFYFKDGNIIWFKKKSDVDSKFVQYCFQSQEVLRQVQSGANGATVGTFTIEKAKKTKIPLPPLATQKKIAAILDAADAHRQKTKQLLAKYDELAQSIFLDMFGDPVTNPKGWKKRTLDKLLTRKTQNGHYAPKDVYSEEGVQMVHMSDAFYQILEPGEFKRVLVSDGLRKKYEINDSDILVARRSLNYEGAAKPCMVPKYSEPLIYESSLIRLTPDQKVLTPIYLFYFLNNDRARGAYVLKHVTKSTISGINNKGLNAVEIVLPPIELQKQFLNIVKVIEMEKVIAKQSLEKAEELFQGLLQKAFKGELVE
ncbi:restriction endonuclease subunit S [Echinicola vietnamensis]|uniref:Restriction endonuclease S subunit n=1 Tax=Echinicola vietnamensis (strain DSM 17526 / LMG 23754 / KMM 6221) TaxID=926556 RepID=L0FRZ5_ECHVK|nr:restriction endonuclease subunit S [Echinicola vietnamensis]AGA76709.1 restriction endonuclease S subunit [Echinicola vietnamensis DSM 17526]